MKNETPKLDQIPPQYKFTILFQKKKRKKEHTLT